MTRSFKRCVFRTVCWKILSLICIYNLPSSVKAAFTTPVRSCKDLDPTAYLDDILQHYARHDPGAFESIKTFEKFQNVVVEPNKQQIGKLIHALHAKSKTLKEIVGTTEDEGYFDKTFRIRELLEALEGSVQESSSKPSPEFTADDVFTNTFDRKYLDVVMAIEHGKILLDNFHNRIHWQAVRRIQDWDFTPFSEDDHRRKGWFYSNAEHEMLRGLYEFRDCGLEEAKLLNQVCTIMEAQIFNETLSGTRSLPRDSSGTRSLPPETAIHEFSYIPVGAWRINSNGNFFLGTEKITSGDEILSKLDYVLAQIQPNVGALDSRCRIPLYKDIIKQAVSTFWFTNQHVYLKFREHMVAERKMAVPENSRDFISLKRLWYESFNKLRMLLGELWGLHLFGIFIQAGRSVSRVFSGPNIQEVFHDRVNKARSIMSRRDGYISKVRLPQTHAVTIAGEPKDLQPMFLWQSICNWVKEIIKVKKEQSLRLSENDTHNKTLGDRTPTLKLVELGVFAGSTTHRVLEHCLLPLQRKSLESIDKTGGLDFEYHIVDPWNMLEGKGFKDMIVDRVWKKQVGETDEDPGDAVARKVVEKAAEIIQMIRKSAIQSASQSPSSAESRSSSFTKRPFYGVHLVDTPDYTSSGRIIESLQSQFPNGDVDSVKVGAGQGTTKPQGNDEGAKRSDVETSLMNRDLFDDSGGVVDTKGNQNIPGKLDGSDHVFEKGGVFVHRTTSVNASPYLPNDLDLVFVDAGHDFRDVLNDLKHYTPKTKYVIGGHDFLSWQSIGVVAAVLATIVPGATVAWEQFGGEHLENVPLLLDNASMFWMPKHESLRKVFD